MICIISLSLFALLVLLRAVYVWGKAQGELDEYNRHTPERWDHQ